MPIDSKQKRMSALHLASPWRGPLVDAPEAGFTQGNRQAADYLYSGILAGGGGGGGGVELQRPEAGAVWGERPPWSW